ncbi:MAG TPA: PIG-L family deacetylase [Gemmatimonadales bacterium]
MIAPRCLAQLAPPSGGGIVRLDRLLQRLAEPRRVLVVGAHPDDEDTSLLALLARGYGADAAYLALSRGEGGQNLIGDQLGAALGLIRSRELESARDIDGAQQFFTRSYDFGYTRSLEETARLWPADSVLKDVVRIIRRFRPHVIVPVFSGTARDGHGQHQMSGVAARRAFDAAADPNAFPELATDEGLAPWTPLKLYGSARFNRAIATLTLPTGSLDPHTGRSYYQIAMASRSRHRSQDFGTLQPVGPYDTRLGLIEDRTGAGPDAGLFDGIDAADGEARALADSLRGVITAATMTRAVSPLLGALRRARAAPGHERAVRLLSEAIGVAAGLVMDARAHRAEALPGETLGVEVELYNAGLLTVRLDSVRITSRFADPVYRALAHDVAPRTTDRSAVRLDVAASAAPSQPYFLTRPLQGYLYDWSGVAPELRGTVFEPPAIEAAVAFSLDGVPIVLTREVSYRYADQAVGEIREPVRVVPRIDVRLDPDQFVWSTLGDPTRTFTVTLAHNAATPVEGDVALAIDGWPPPPPQRFRLQTQGEEQTFAFVVDRPVNVREADVTVQAIATASGGQRYEVGTRLLTFPHIRPTQMVVPATSRVRVSAIATPPLRTVGYIRGAADRVPEALERVGLPIALIDPTALATADLAQFDVIVVGSRAYETDTALTRHNDRLLDYVRAGGHVVVQYQQYAYVRGRYAPFALDMNRPHDRITDETAPVTILDPAHPAFVFPNRIEDGDWDGWPQERGLYFAGTWDSAYTPLLEMTDPDRPPIRGGLLVAALGKGTYVYTGLSFFRALPAGTPGAFRLFLNLLGLGVSRAP